MCGFVFYDDDSDSNMLRVRARLTYQAYHSMQCDFVAKCFVYYIFSDGLSAAKAGAKCVRTQETKKYTVSYRMYLLGL